MGLCDHLHCLLPLSQDTVPPLTVGVCVPYQLVCGKLEHVQPDMRWGHPEQTRAVHTEGTLP